MARFAFIENKNYYLFLIFSIFFSIVLAFLTVAKYGASVSGDGVIYLSVADNLVAGKGFFDHTGAPLIWFPPLYSLILAFLQKISGADILAVGTYFQIFLLGINLFLAGLILQLSFPKNSTYKYLGILFIITSDTFLHQHLGIITEPLFITLSFIFILTAGFYLNDWSKFALPLMILSAALASLARWVGLSLVVLGGIVILLKHKDNLRSFFRDAFIFGFFSGLPLVAWSVGHNFAKYGTLWGAAGIDSLPALNLKLSLIKIIHWFLPLYPIENPFIGHPYLILGSIVILIILFNKKENWRAWREEFQNPFVFSAIFFGAIYLTTLVFTVSTYDHISLLSTRYYPILMLPVLLLIFISIKTLILPHLLQKPKIWLNASIIFLLLWSLYPLRSLYKFVREAKKAEFSWTAKKYQELNWNSTLYHETEIFAQLDQRLAINPDLIIYSNYTDPVWLFNRVPVRMLPTTPPDVLDEELIAKNQNFFTQKENYIVWFTPNAYEHIVPIEVISQIVPLELVYQDEVGQLYRIQVDGD